jgi:cysteine-rich repeat protein
MEIGRLLGLATAPLRRAGLVFAMLAFAASASAQTTVITTDDTWKATAVDPGPATDWRDSLLFDDSSWEDASVWSQTSLNGDLVDLIWSADVGCNPGSVDVWLRKVFTLPGAPNRALLSFGVDDDAEIFINGSLVADFFATTELDIDVAPYLVVGQNLLAVHAADSAGGCRSFTLRLAASVSCGDQAVDAGEDCDDGNLSNGDCCSADCQAEAAGNPCAADGDPCTLDVCDSSGTCGAAPTGCRSAGKSLLLIKNNSTDARDKVIWKWLRGDQTDLTDFGSPNAATWHTLCLESATASMSLGIPAGVEWEAAGANGFKFKSLGPPDGVQRALLKSGAAGKAKVLLKGKGENIPDTLAPMLDLPVTARLVNNSSGVCFEAVYDAGDVIKNDSTQFKAKAEVP